MKEVEDTAKIWLCDMGADLVRIIPHYGNRPDAVKRRVVAAAVAACEKLGVSPKDDPECVARREAAQSA